MLQPKIVNLYVCKVCGVGNLMWDEMFNTTEPKCLDCKELPSEQKTKQRTKKLQHEPAGSTKNP